MPSSRRQILQTMAYDCLASQRFFPLFPGNRPLPYFLENCPSPFHSTLYPTHRSCHVTRPKRSHVGLELRLMEAKAAEADSCWGCTSSEESRCWGPWICLNAHPPTDLVFMDFSNSCFSLLLFGGRGVCLFVCYVPVVYGFFLVSHLSP